MTEKLYYEDSNRFEFQAMITDRVREKNRLALILDKTFFYPEGGGQPSDRGQINGIPVSDVQTKQGRILHYVEKDPGTDTISARVDKTHRKDYVQQHTGQHILSQCLLKAGKIKTVSVHFGEEETYIETDAASITEDLLAEIEKLANTVINDDIEVVIKWVNASELHKHPTRRPPPDVERVRIVQIGDFDATACGGLHVTSTGKVGLCKITGSEKIRGHVRIHTKIGDRAFRDYQEKTRLVRELGLFLTCGEDVILKRVSDLNDSYAEVKKQMKRYLSEWIPLLFKDILKTAPEINGITLIQHVFDNVDQKALKLFMEQALADPNRMAIVINKVDDRLNWMIGHSIETGFNLMELVRDYLPLIDAKGGGRGSLVQGGGGNTDGIAEFLIKIRNKLERNG